MNVLVIFWGIRLSANFARKGGYSGTEDYRWTIIHKKLNNEILWVLFNLFFICTYQIFLLILFTLPIYLSIPIKSVNTKFFASSFLAILFILIESIADQQQWDFQQEKHRSNSKNKNLTEDIKNGFLTRGLFSFSRHPNYFGELGFWWSIWLMSFSLIGNVWKSGVIGPITLTLLFIGSTIFTEQISSSKYPEYKNYCQSVSPIIPWFPKRKTLK